MLTCYHLLPGLEFLEPGRVLPVPAEQTFQEMVEAQEEWQPPPRGTISFPTDDDSKQRIAVQKRVRPRQQQALHEDVPPVLVHEDVPKQSQALSLAKENHSRADNHGFDRTYTYHSPWRTVKVAPKYQSYLSYSNSKRTQVRPRRSFKATSRSCPEGFTASADNKISCIGDLLALLKSLWFCVCVFYITMPVLCSQPLLL